MVINTNTYRGDGQRISRTENGAATLYTYQDGAVLATSDSAGTMKDFYLNAPGGDLISLMTDQGQSFRGLTKDIRTSTTTVLGDGGTYDSGFSYSDFGETTRLGGTVSPLDIAYTGGIWDESTGLYYLNSRYYHPAEARFMTRDGAKNGGDLRATLSLYGYGEGDPINNVDPSGRWGWSVHYIGTNVWAQTASSRWKMSSRDANALASADQQIDQNPGTWALSVFDTQLSWHFNRGSNWRKVDSRDEHFNSQRRNAERIWKAKKAGFRNAAMREYGFGLHALQDKYAHLDWAVGSRPVWIHMSNRDGLKSKRNKDDFDDPNYYVLRSGNTYMSKYVGSKNNTRYQKVETNSKLMLAGFMKHPAFAGDQFLESYAASASSSCPL